MCLIALLAVLILSLVVICFIPKSKSSTFSIPLSIHLSISTLFKPTFSQSFKPINFISSKYLLFIPFISIPIIFRSFIFTFKLTVSIFIDVMAFQFILIKSLQLMIILVKFL